MITQKEYCHKQCCPVCQSDNIEYGDSDYDWDGNYCHEAWCCDCEAKWDEVYQLVGYATLCNDEEDDDPHDCPLCGAEETVASSGGRLKCYRCLEVSETGIE